jgi:ubiquinone/menaquinone biosynthesis C-methylase UbiE
MDWQKYWDKTAMIDDGLSQVGRNFADSETSLAKAGERIISLLELKPEDNILDLCCGNGLITNYISQKGFKISGVDLSAKLISRAKQLNGELNFHQMDALSFDLDESFSKMFIAFSFQYFDSYEKGKQVIENMLRHARPGAMILLTDVPDKSKWADYYNSFIKKVFYFKHKFTGKQSMGKFWSEKELNVLCRSL